MQAEKEHVRLHTRDSERAKVHVHVHEHRLNNGRIAKQQQHGRTLQGKQRLQPSWYRSRGHGTNGKRYEDWHCETCNRMPEYQIEAKGMQRMLMVRSQVEPSLCVHKHSASEKNGWI